MNTCDSCQCKNCIHRNKIRLVCHFAFIYEGIQYAELVLSHLFIDNMEAD